MPSRYNAVEQMSINESILGTDEDERRITRFFKDVKFCDKYELLEPKRDLGYDDFVDALTEWANLLKNGRHRYHSFFLFIMSHGEKVRQLHMEKIY